MTSTRILKVQEFIIPKKNGNPKKSYPSLKLQGRWLEAARILPDTYVKVEVSDNKLTISIL